MKSRLSPLAWGTALCLLVLLAACKSQFISGGKLHFDQERFDRALENFEKAVAEQPENGEAHLWMGLALAELERDEEAIVAFKKAAELDPEQAETALTSSLSYWSRRYNSAIAYAMDADEADNEETKTEKLKLAEERFHRAIIFAPDSVQNYSNLGKVYYQLGRQDEAMDLFQRSKTMSEGKPHLQKFLFALFKVLGEQALQGGDRESFERALSLLHDAESLPAEPELMLEVNFNLGSAYFGLTDLDEANSAEHLAKAAEYYGKVIDADPADDMALESLAYVYSEQGEHDSAIEIGQMRLDLEPWETPPHLLMQRLYKAAGNDRVANGHLLFIQIMSQGVRQPTADVRARAGEYGPGSNMIKTLRDRGIPEDVRSFSVGATTYEAWFYWTEGRIYIFQGGSEKFRLAFKGLTREKMQEIME